MRKNQMKLKKQKLNILINNTYLEVKYNNKTIYQLNIYKNYFKFKSLLRLYQRNKIEEIIIFLENELKNNKKV